MILEKGIVTVIDGQRIYLRIYRRIFYPINKSINGVLYKFFTDTGRETEINYKRASYYGLDNPFNRIRLIRLARAMNSIECVTLEGGEKVCSVVICSDRELFDYDTNENHWIPFDPSKIESLQDRITKIRKRMEWEDRVGTG